MSKVCVGYGQEAGSRKSSRMMKVRCVVGVGAAGQGSGIRAGPMEDESWE